MTRGLEMFNLLQNISLTKYAIKDYNPLYNKMKLYYLCITITTNIKNLSNLILF